MSGEVEIKYIVPMRPIFIALLLLLTCSFASKSSAVTPSSVAVSSAASVVPKAHRAIWITLEGEVDGGMADYVKRAIGQALESKPDVIIFEINTFGGRLDAAFEIVDTITALKIPTVAYVSQKAISAGALIALSCDKLYMKPATTIGDCAPIIQGDQGPQILGEKIQSPLRAKFRNLAQRNHYPELLSQAMVTPELEVVKVQKGDSIRYMEANTYDELTDAEREEWGSKKTVVREGELLTLTDIEAKAMGFSQATVPEESELLKELGAEDVRKVHIAWAEKLAGWIAAVSPLLMLLAFGALYMEFQVPGFGIFGVTAIALLAIVFGGQYIGGLADQLPLVLLAIGIILIFVEIFFVPGTWIAGIVSIGFIAAALVVLLKDVQPSIPQLPMVPGVESAPLSQALLMVLGSALGAMVIPIFASRYLFSRLPEGMTPMLDAVLGDAHAPQDSRIAGLHVGDHGVVVNQLKLTGKARFAGKVFEVRSRTEFLDIGTPIRVTAIEHEQIIVTRDQENNHAE